MDSLNRRYRRLSQQRHQQQQQLNDHQNLHQYHEIGGNLSHQGITKLNADERYLYLRASRAQRAKTDHHQLTYYGHHSGHDFVDVDANGFPVHLINNGQHNDGTVSNYIASSIGTGSSSGFSSSGNYNHNQNHGNNLTSSSTSSSSSTMSTSVTHSNRQKINDQLINDGSQLKYHWQQQQSQRHQQRRSDIHLMGDSQHYAVTSLIRNLNNGHNDEPIACNNEQQTDDYSHLLSMNDCSSFSRSWQYTTVDQLDKQTRQQEEDLNERNERILNSQENRESRTTYKLNETTISKNDKSKSFAKTRTTDELIRSFVTSSKDHMHYEQANNGDQSIDTVTNGSDSSHSSLSGPAVIGIHNNEMSKSQHLFSSITDLTNSNNNINDSESKNDNNYDTTDEATDTELVLLDNYHNNVGQNEFRVLDILVERLSLLENNEKWFKDDNTIYEYFSDDCYGSSESIIKVSEGLKTIIEYPSINTDNLDDREIIVEQIEEILSELDSDNVPESTSNKNIVTTTNVTKGILKQITNSLPKLLINNCDNISHIEFSECGQILTEVRNNSKGFKFIIGKNIKEEDDDVYYCCSWYDNWLFQSKNDDDTIKGQSSLNDDRMTYPTLIKSQYSPIEITSPPIRNDFCLKHREVWNWFQDCSLYYHNILSRSEHTRDPCTDKISIPGNDELVAHLSEYLHQFYVNTLANRNSYINELLIKDNEFCSLCNSNELHKQGYINNNDEHEQVLEYLWPENCSKFDPIRYLLDSSDSDEEEEMKKSNDNSSEISSLVKVSYDTISGSLHPFGGYRVSFNNIDINESISLKLMRNVRGRKNKKSEDKAYEKLLSAIFYHVPIDSSETTERDSEYDKEEVEDDYGNGCFEVRNARKKCKYCSSSASSSSGNQNGNHRNGMTLNTKQNCNVTLNMISTDDSRFQPSTRPQQQNLEWHPRISTSDVTINDNNSNNNEGNDVTFKQHQVVNRKEVENDNNMHRIANNEHSQPLSSSSLGASSFKSSFRSEANKTSEQYQNAIRFKKNSGNSDKEDYCQDYNDLKHQCTCGRIGMEIRNSVARQRSKFARFVLRPIGANLHNKKLPIIQFYCRISGSLPLSIQWFKGGKALIRHSDDDKDDNNNKIELTSLAHFDLRSHLDKRYRLIRDKNICIFEISNMDKNLDEDDYYCCVFNRYNKCWSRFNLNFVHATTSKTNNDHHRDYEQHDEFNELEQIKLKKIHQDNSTLARLNKHKSINIIHGQFPLKPAHLHKDGDSDESPFLLRTWSQRKDTETTSCNQLGQAKLSEQQQNPISSMNMMTPMGELEHSKWNTATATIPNNPYSVENLTKRLMDNRMNCLTSSSIRFKQKQHHQHEEESTESPIAIKVLKVEKENADEVELKILKEEQHEPVESSKVDLATSHSDQLNYRQDNNEIVNDYGHNDDSFDKLNDNAQLDSHKSNRKYDFDNNAIMDDNRFDQVEVVQPKPRTSINNNSNRLPSRHCKSSSSLLPNKQNNTTINNYGPITTSGFLDDGGCDKIMCNIDLNAGHDQKNSCAPPRSKEKHDGDDPKSCSKAKTTLIERPIILDQGNLNHHETNNHFYEADANKTSANASIYKSCEEHREGEINLSPPPIHNDNSTTANNNGAVCQISPDNRLNLCMTNNNNNNDNKQNSIGNNQQEEHNAAEYRTKFIKTKKSQNKKPSVKDLISRFSQPSK